MCLWHTDWISFFLFEWEKNSQQKEMYKNKISLYLQANMFKKMSRSGDERFSVIFSHCLSAVAIPAQQVWKMPSLWEWRELLKDVKGTRCF